MKHRSQKPSEPSLLNAASRIVAGLCALAVIFLGSYYAYRAGASGLDQSYANRRSEVAAKTVIHRATADRTVTLRHDDPPAEATPSDGELFAYVRVPSFSKQYRLPVWEGTEKTVLDQMGAGHYAGSAMPGQVGNSAYAGHNTYADFADIRLLKPGDHVYIETATRWYRYTVNSDPQVIEQTRTDALDADAAGVERGLTLQTCWPIMASNVHQRLIVYGTFDGWADKNDGTPADLAETTDTAAERLGRRIVETSDRLDTPVTGVLGLCSLAIWLLLDLVGWMCSHRRMRSYWHDVGDPFTWLWRINAGLFPNHTVVFTLTRLVPYAFMWAGLVFLSWRYVCPQLAAMGFLLS